MGLIPNGQKPVVADTDAALYAGYYLCLYQSAHTPVVTDTASVYTSIECNFAGYDRVSLGAFMAAYLNGMSEGEADHDSIIFVCTGSSPSNQIFGCFILDGSGNLAFMEEYVGSAFFMDAIGKTWTVNPLLIMDNLP